MQDQKFETAKLAKNKGFDEPILKHWEKGNSNFDEHWGLYQSRLQKWLREKHNIMVFVLPDSSGMWGYSYMVKGASHTQGTKFELDEIVGSYEQALETGLQKALKLIKIG